MSTTEQRLKASLLLNVLLLAVVIFLFCESAGAPAERVRVVTKTVERKVEVPVMVGGAVAPPPPVIPEKLPDEVNEEGDRLRMRRWRTERRVRDVERFVALTPEEREKLGSAFAENPNRTEVLREVLGEERAARYAHDRAEAEKREEVEEFEQEVFTLSRRLALTPGQEIQVRDVMEKIRDDVAPMEAAIRERGRQAEQEHSRPGGSENLQGIYTEMRELIRELKAKKNLLTVERLREILSDEQMNALTKIQAETRDSFFGE